MDISRDSKGDSSGTGQMRPLLDLLNGLRYRSAGSVADEKAQNMTAMISLTMSLPQALLRLSFGKIVSILIGLFL
ncbi:MAG: hypothetical protein P8X39_05070 [Desulfofustis sp.]